MAIISMFYGIIISQTGKPLVYIVSPEKPVFPNPT